MKKVLFLCTGNSCRSQMAEGLLRSLSNNSIETYSAGTRPSYVHPKAIEVMKELDIDISNQKSEHVDKYLNSDIDTVITVCDNAKESCPNFPKKVSMINWSFPDPADATGESQEVLDFFRKVRDMIQEKIKNELL